MISEQYMADILAKLENELKSVKKAYDAENFPDGRLVINKNGNSYKRFQVIKTKSGNIRTYLNKDDMHKAEKLALKGYYERKLYTLSREIKSVEAFMKNIPKRTPDKLLYDSPEYRRLLMPYMVNSRDIVDKFLTEDYEKNTGHPESLKIQTMKGELVRSKSEALIADELFRRKIPYRYECRLSINNAEAIYPDFTILNPDNGKKYIWEHFGLMDDANYLSGFIYKMKLYVNNGYIPSINLITSFENQDNPLSLVNVSRIIDNYFAQLTVTI